MDILSQDCLLWLCPRHAGQGEFVSHVTEYILSQRIGCCMCITNSGTTISGMLCWAAGMVGGVAERTVVHCLPLFAASYFPLTTSNLNSWVLLGILEGAKASLNVHFNDVVLPERLLYSQRLAIDPRRYEGKDDIVYG